MIKIDVVCCAYSSPQLIRRFWRSLRREMNDQRLDVRLQLYVHGHWDDVRAACNTIYDGRSHETEVVLFDHGYNRGLARSWGEGIHNAYQTERDADVVVIANDDIEFSTGDLFTLARAAYEASPDVYAVMGTGLHGVHGAGQSFGHSLFAYTRAAEETIGYPDVNFFPAYCEDQDLWWRAKLAGMHEFGVVLGGFHAGSAHIRGVSVPADRAAAIRAQSSITQSRNQAYLFRKWGALDPAGFTYTSPFNDEAFDETISWERFNAPYPGYDRTDQGVVKL